MRYEGMACILGIAIAVSCGGGTQVGMEDPDGGSGGTQPGAGKSGTSGNTGSSGATSKGGSASGGEPAAVGGEGGAAPAPTSRCGFAPDDVGASSGPFAPGDVVLGRITLFLADAAADPAAQTPAEATASWASETAMSILDAGDTAGLSRFLETWLDAPETFNADVWSAKLGAADATLATLLAEPASDAQRIGILTDEELLNQRGLIAQRGAWLNERLFCGAVPLPPANLPASEQLPDETRRQALTRNVAPAQCAACHVIIDPPGWALEHFDENGLYRELDNGQPVDSSGTFTVGQEEFAYESIDDLAPQLAESCEVALCFTRAMLSHTFPARDPATGLPYSEAEVHHVANRFADSGFSIRELVKAIVETPTFLQ